MAWYLVKHWENFTFYLYLTILISLHPKLEINFMSPSTFYSDDFSITRVLGKVPVCIANGTGLKRSLSYKNKTKQSHAWQQ